MSFQDLYFFAVGSSGFVARPSIPAHCIFHPFPIIIQILVRLSVFWDHSILSYITSAGDDHSSHCGHPTKSSPTSRPTKHFLFCEDSLEYVTKCNFPAINGQNTVGLFHDSCHILNNRVCYAWALPLPLLGCEWLEFRYDSLYSAPSLPPQTTQHRASHFTRCLLRWLDTMPPSGKACHRAVGNHSCHNGLNEKITTSNRLLTTIPGKYREQVS